jgi:1-acyl-sn-glycerol-3-phosphate acyltransferase/nucleoside-diphosphate-sugar epimerase
MTTAVFGAADALTELVLDGLPEGHRVASPRDLAGMPAAAVYLASARGDDWGLPDAADAAACLGACRAAGVAHVVVVSSAMAATPHAHHPGFVSESQPAPRGAENPVAAAWRTLEECAAAALREETLTILRPAAMPLREGRDSWSRCFAGRWAAVAAGRDPSLQLLAPEDFLAALRAALTARRPGIYHVAPAGVVPLRHALRLAGERPLTLSRRLRRALAAVAGRDAPPAGLPEYTRYFWTVSGDAIQRDLGFAPRRTSAEAAGDLAVARSRPAREPRPPVEDFDAHGMDLAFIQAHGRRLVGFLRSVWWRVEERGFEAIPRKGGAVLVGMHRGFMPWDGVMALHGVLRSTGRAIRFLIHPGLLRFPFLFDFMIKQGGVPASRENAARLLGRGELVGVFPEGIRGAFSYYRDAYRVHRAWRSDYAALALRHQVPVVPFVTVGSAEIFPILGRIEWRWWRQVSEWPFVPVTPTFPLLPVPLPSKWHTRYLPPIATAGRFPPAAADDPAVVAELDREVRAAMLGALAEMRRRRRSWFFGSIFEDPETPAAGPSC